MWWTAVGAAVVGAVALQLGVAEPHGGSRLSDDLEALRNQVEKLEGRARKLETRALGLETLQDSFADRLDELQPGEAKWLSLRPGTSEYWDHPVTGRAQVQVLEITEAGEPRFQLKSKAFEGAVTLRPGLSLHAVDDLGTTRQIIETRLLQVRMDRSGVPADALMSVRVVVEGG